jgi:hypothetical protein
MVIGAIVVLSVASAQGSTLTLNAQLVVTPDFSGVSPVWHVAIQVQSIGTTDGSIEFPLSGDGGLAATQFDVISSGSASGVTSVPGASSPVQQAPSSSKVKTVFSLSSSDFATLIRPDRVDATPLRDPGSHPTLYNSDGDLDALGGGIADSALGYTLTDVGRNGFRTIATEDWQLTNPSIPDHLELVLAGAEYYDFGSGHQNTNFLVNYAAVNTSGANLLIPEPGSFVLISLGALVSAVGILKRRNGLAVR